MGPKADRPASGLNDVVGGGHSKNVLNSSGFAGHSEIKKAEQSQMDSEDDEMGSINSDNDVEDGEEQPNSL